MNRESELELGEVVELFAAPGEPLPAGITDGFQARLIGSGSSHRLVERDGQEWQVKPGQVRPRRARRPVSAALVSPGRCRL
jgi:hypothetical protein